MMRDLWFTRIAVAGNRAGQGLLMSHYASTESWRMVGAFLPFYWPEHDFMAARLAAADAAHARKGK